MGPSQRLRADRDRAGAEISPGFGFDLDHTLLIDNHLERIAFLRLLEGLPSRGRTSEQEERAVDDLLALQRSGAFSIEEAVRRLAAERGATAGDAMIDEYKATALALVPACVVAMPGAAATLAALRARGNVVAALSNGWSPLQERKAARIGFDAPVVVSGVIGVQKPDPRAFAALLDVMGLPAGDVCYVGDDPSADVAGAIGAGLRGIWLNERGGGYPRGLPAPARVIASLTELLAPA